jgi:MoaA/NifB/PqqE/SkfB family radical SAM enzyme
MLSQTLSHTYKRYRTLQTDTIRALPIVILMPHSACNCRCVMCDIWKGNKNLKQLTEDDIAGLLSSLKKFETTQVLMSGGEALLNKSFFRFCEMLNMENIKVTLLSTGLTIKNNAQQLTQHVNDIIVSIDGDEETHDAIRNIPGAYRKIKEGVEAIRAIDPGYKITARTVIHKLNYYRWASIINSAKQLGLDQISFLPADVSSHAFNREMLWDENKQHEILLSVADLSELKNIIQKLVSDFQPEFENHFIADSPGKIYRIYEYYAAFYELNSFPYKKCNAPWVSTVIEADGTVRPCFFHKQFGNIREQTLDKILNSEKAIKFRKNLDIENDPTCIKCVCYLNLKPGYKI